VVDLRLEDSVGKLVITAIQDGKEL